MTPHHERPRKALASNAHPLVRHVVAVVDHAGASYTAIERKAGVHERYISDMKHAVRGPNLLSVDSLLRACGYKLIIVPFDRTDKVK